MPQLFGCLKNYSYKRLFADVLSGIIVAIIALPLAIANTLPIGLTAEQGIITAIIAGFLGALLSGSKYQICGPTNTFIITAFTVVATFGYGGLVVATITAGVILLVSGLLKFGNAIKYFPYPITVGFTAGLALLLLNIQFKDFFGFSDITTKPDFIPRLIEYFTDINTINFWSLGIGVFSIAILLIIPKLTKKIPPAIIAVVLTSLIVWIFKIPTNTIASLSSNSSSLPMFQFGDISNFFKLLPYGVSIALLCAVESLLTTVATDTMTGERSNCNTELVSQGLINIIAPMFGGIPSAGALARSAANVRNGATSPVSSFVHSVALLLIFLVLMPLAKFIPLACLAAILIIVAINMAGIRIVKKMFFFTKRDLIILISTFLLTVFIDLISGVVGGLIIALCLYGKKLFKKSAVHVEQIHDDYLALLSIDDRQNEKMAAVKIDGDFFFKNAFHFFDAVQKATPNIEILFLDFSDVNYMDTSALNVLQKITNGLEKQNIDTYFVNADKIDIFYEGHYLNKHKKHVDITQ